MAPLLELWLLGPWQARLNQTPLAALPTRHTQVLLARLALAHPDILSRASLREDLFPHDTEKIGSNKLRTTLYFLRRAIGAYLHSDRHQVMLDPALVVVHDLARFKARTAPGASQPALEEAVTLYRGPFLDRPTEGWAAAEARRIHTSYIDTLRRLVALARATGTPDAALDAARRWAAEEPWEETAHIASIRALMAIGEYDAAVTHIVRARTLLRTEWRDMTHTILGELAREVGRHTNTGRPLLAADQKRHQVSAPSSASKLPSLPERPANGERSFEYMQHTNADTDQEALVEALEAAERARVGGQFAAMQYALNVAEKLVDMLNLTPLDERRFRFLVLRERYCSAADPGDAWTASLDALLELAETSGRIDWRITEAHANITSLLADTATTRYPTHTATALCVLGLIQIADNDYRTGLMWLRESVRQMQECNEQRAITLCQSTLCFAVVHFGLYQEAQALAEATLPLTQQIDDLRRLSVLLYCMARIALFTGDAAYAWQLAQEANDIVTTLQMPYYMVVSLGQMAEIALTLGYKSAARTAVDRLEPLLTTAQGVNVAHIAARVWLMTGERERARQAAHHAITNLATTGLMPMTASEALWSAAVVLDKVDGEQVAQPVRERAVTRFLDDLVGLVETQLRRAFIAATPIHQELSQFARTGARRLIFLPLKDAPTGRPLHPDELAPVVWTIDVPDDPPSRIARRRQQVRRLAIEATIQGAVATVKALAEVLAVSESTIHHDLHVLAEADVVVETRGSTGRRKSKP